MTPTIAAATPPLDLDRLESLANNATPGPYAIGTYRVVGGGAEMQYPGQGVDWHDISTLQAKYAHGGYLTVIGQYDYEEGGVIREADAHWFAACDPTTIKSLVALARAADMMADILYALDSRDSSFGALPAGCSVGCEAGYEAHRCPNNAIEGALVAYEAARGRGL